MGELKAGEKEDTRVDNFFEWECDTGGVGGESECVNLPVNIKIKSLHFPLMNLIKGCF